jgi:serine/threonine protein kinase
MEFGVVKALGEGANVPVHLMKRRATNKQIVIKSFHAMTDQSQTYLTREIEALIILRHPLLVWFYGCVLPADERCAKIATCRVDGPTLKEVMERNPRWWNSMMKTCTIVGIALGMQAVHSVEIMRRDVKPSNVLVDANHRICICDFGSSRFAHID